MSINEISTDERSDAVQLAGALQVKVDEVYERNDSLEAENDSLRTGFEAVSQENEHLRKFNDKIVRQRDAAMRRAELAESKLKIIYAEASSYLKAAHKPETAEQQHNATVAAFAPPRIRNQT